MGIAELGQVTSVSRETVNDSTLQTGPHAQHCGFPLISGCPFRAKTDRSLQEKAVFGLRRRLRQRGSRSVLGRGRYDRRTLSIRDVASNVSNAQIAVID